MKGEEFREIRQRLGLSHRRLGEILELSPHTIMRREKAERVKNIEALAITALAQIARSNPHHWRRRVLDSRAQRTTFLDAWDLHEDEDLDTLESVAG